MEGEGSVGEVSNYGLVRKNSSSDVAVHLPSHLALRMVDR
jgi:hypothetical protein